MGGRMFTNLFRGAAFVLAFAFSCVLISQVREIQLLTTTTHIASQSVHHPYDHHYITADSWIHPIDRPMHEKVRVDNTCRIWKDGTWVFCGMLPWQHNPCQWTGKNASVDFIQYIKAEHYELAVGSQTDLLTDFVKMQRLDVADDPAILHKSTDVCQYENFHDLQMIRNEPDSFSIASTHSPVVLMWGAWLVLTVCYAMGGKKAFADMFVKQDGKNQDTVKYVQNAFDMVFFAVLVFLFFLTRFTYASNMAESGSVIVPNASFVYVFFAVAWTLFWTRSDAGDATEEKNTPFPEIPKADVVMNNQLVDTPKDTNIGGDTPLFGRPNSREILNGVVVNHSHMSIDVSNFAGTKLKTRGYLQAGINGRYPDAASLTDVDVDLKASLKELTADDYANVNFESGRFYIAQLWAVPFTVLSLFLFDSGFAMDIDVTFVAVMSFLFAIIDVFVAKLRNVSGIMDEFAIDSVSENRHITHAMRYALLLVQFVLIFIESCVLWVLYYFIEPRVQETSMKTERLNAMTVFFSFHVILSGFMLFLQAVGGYKIGVFQHHSNLMRDYTHFEWRHVVHAVRQLNLFLFCFLAWVYVLRANDSAGHLALNNNMNIFSGNDACKQEVDNWIQLSNVAQMPAACSLGLSFSNLYSQGSSIRFKAAHEMQLRLNSLHQLELSAQNTAVATTPVATTPAPSTRR